MLQEINYPKSKEYRTGSKNEPIYFFLQVLPESKRFDILLGYFSSSAINVLSLGMASFILNGGRIRMIINHILSAKDKETLLKGINTSERDFDFSMSDYEKIKNSLNEYGHHFFECIAWLIAAKRIEIKVVKPLEGKGLSHYKSGIFDDGQSQVRFRSSCNFTASGLLENLEELEIKQSWSSESEEVAIDEYKEYFDCLFKGDANFAKYLSFEEIEEAIISDFGNKDIQELLINECSLIEKKKEITNKEIIRKILTNINNTLEKQIDEPRFPFPSPREYQIEAYENWLSNGCKGVFAMATGTGKTLTALNCVLNEYRKTGTYRAIILVPTIELVYQWQREIEKFKFKNTVLISAKNNNWRNDLNKISSLARHNDKYSFFIISTYRSFTSSKFQSTVNSLPKDTFFIADETHNLGAKSILPHIEEFSLDKRMGLSATPERIYDDLGSNKVNAFFNDFRPYTYEFSMKLALEKGYLCKYYYYPHLVELSDSELSDYIDLSNSLSKLFNSEKQVFKEKAKKLLLLRKQIIHKASQKIELFETILNKLKENGSLKHTLVYAPEGYYNSNHFESESSYALGVDENRICEFYANRVRVNSPNTRVALFHSGTKNRKQLLTDFENSEIDILVSMKCLDEGVDIPRTQQAIFCASTGNPRQFIQRRGRILRTHKNKSSAIIHDLVVVPSLSKIHGAPSIEKRLVENELLRVKEFSSLAVNKYEALERIQSIIDLFKIQKIY